MQQSELGQGFGVFVHEVIFVQPQVKSKTPANLFPQKQKGLVVFLQGFPKLRRISGPDVGAMKGLSCFYVGIIQRQFQSHIEGFFKIRLCIGVGCFCRKGMISTVMRGMRNQDLFLLFQGLLVKLPIGIKHPLDQFQRDPMHGKGKKTDLPACLTNL